MTIKTIDDVDQVVQQMLDTLTGHTSLMGFLEGCSTPKERWEILEKHVLNHLDDFGLTKVEYAIGEDMFISPYFIRDRFFYEIQQTTGMDFGFCRHYDPVYRAWAKYALTGQETNENNWAKCTFGEKPNLTVCLGYQRDECKLLKSEE